MKNLKAIFLGTFFVFALSAVKAQAYFGNINKAADEVKATLAAHNPAAVKSKAQALIFAISQPERIGASQRAAFGSYIGVLLVEARHITETLNLSHQQEHYDEFMKKWTEAKTKLKIK